MKKILRKQQEEYKELVCPICGCIPALTSTGVDYCGHPELERLIDEVDNSLLGNESGPHYIKPFSKGSKPILKIMTSTDPKSSSKE